MIIILHCFIMILVIKSTHGQCTEYEIEKVRLQASDRDINKGEMEHVENAITNCRASRKLIEMGAANGNIKDTEHLKYELETSFIDIINFVTSKPFSKDRLARNRMLTEASIKQSNSFESVPRMKEDIVAKRNVDMLLLYLNITYKELLARAESANLKISMEVRNDLIASIHRYYDLEVNRIRHNLSNVKDSEAKQAYRIRFEIDSKLQQWETV